MPRWPRRSTSTGVPIGSEPEECIDKLAGKSFGTEVAKERVDLLDVDRLFLRARRDREEPLASPAMRAVLYEGFGEAPRVASVADPAPPPHGVVVRVEATGLCRSDWHGWMGHDPDIRAFPHVPGHELAGVVEAVGPEVRKWAPGARVTVPFVCACGDCEQCAAGNEQICDRQRQPGFTHWGSLRRARRARLGRRQPRRAARRRRRGGGGRARLPLRHRLPRGRAGRAGRSPASGSRSTAAAASGCRR